MQTVTEPRPEGAVTRTAPAPRRSSTPRSRESGGALLLVLWLVAGLTAIAFALASTVRGESERAATGSDSTRAYYLACGAVERATLWMEWGARLRPGGLGPYYVPGMARLAMEFPEGLADVEVIPETAKLNLNTATPVQLLALLASLGVPPDRGRVIAEAIVDWRNPGATGYFDQFYLSATPSFRARHASFEETEELLLVRGMTPELYYGTWERDAQGNLRPRGGLRDCVSIFGVTDQFDVNGAHPALLAALGLPPQAVAAIVSRRSVEPFRSAEQLGGMLAGAGVPGGRLSVGGHSMFTLRATARLRLPDGQLSDLRRSVAALVKFLPPGFDAQVQTLRWYDDAFRN